MDKQSTLDLYYKKWLMLQDALAIESDVTIKFKLQHELIEINQKISELELVNIYYDLPKVLLPDLDYFVGRTEKVNEILNKLWTTKKPVLIKGMGGVGKSFLAYKIINTLIEGQYSHDGQIYIDLREESFHLSKFSEDEIKNAQKTFLLCLIKQFITKKNNALNDNRDSLLKLWLAIIENKNILIFLDNADYEGVEEIISPTFNFKWFTNRCSLIITSRRVLSLLFPTHIVSLEPFIQDEAISLLANKTRDLVSLSEKQVNYLVKLCGYLPLALNIVANNISIECRNSADVDYYILLLASERDRLSQLQVTGRIMSPNLNVEACLNLSLKGLNDELYNLWINLSVFYSFFDVFDICVMQKKLEPLNECQERLDSIKGPLRTLFNYSLLDFFPKKISSEQKKRPVRNRYRMHELLRELAFSKINVQEYNKLKYLHASYYLLVLQEAECRFSKDNQIGALQYLDRYLLDIMEGQAWAIKQFNMGHQNVAGLVVDYARFAPQCLLLRTTPSTFISWLEAALYVMEYVTLEQHKEKKAYISNLLGVIYYQTYKLEDALNYYNQAFLLAKETGSLDLEVACLTNLVVTNKELGKHNYVCTIWNYRKLLKKCSKLDYELYKNQILINLALNYREIGKFKQSLQYITDALNTNNGNLQKEGECLNVRGSIYEAISKYDLAMDDYQKALDVFNQMGSLFDKGLLLNSMARLQAYMGHYEQAISYAKEGIDIANQLEVPMIYNVCYTALGFAYLLYDDLFNARLAIEEAKKYSQFKHNYEVDFLSGLISLGYKENESAQVFFNNAIDNAETLVNFDTRDYNAILFKTLSQYCLECNKTAAEKTIEKLHNKLPIPHLVIQSMLLSNLINRLAP